VARPATIGRRAGETFGQQSASSAGCRSRGVPDSFAGTAPEGRNRAPVWAFALSFAVIFVAELGDKSQLMAMTLAARYRPLPVLAGITVATAVVHAVSVGLGAAIGVALPTDVIAVLAGVAFLFFAAWTLRGDELSEEEKAGGRSARSVFVASTVTFFLAELGDKTMLATITLATREGLFGTWLGSTLGMVAADALAIGVGILLGRHLPERVIRIGAALTFVVFGVLLILEGAGVL
jgi:putative Ca2+/H+ antiporter (TMEM165/GDT1 family)